MLCICGAVLIPPKERRAVIDKLAEFVKRNGQQFEDKVRHTSVHKVQGGQRAEKHEESEELDTIQTISGVPLFPPPPPTHVGLLLKLVRGGVVVLAVPGAGAGGGEPALLLPRPQRHLLQVLPLPSTHRGPSTFPPYSSS